VLRLQPWHLRVFPGEFARSGGTTGRILTWQQTEGAPQQASVMNAT
jgi:hypothetical protein